jgi:hypothetical protein
VSSVLPSRISAARASSRSVTTVQPRKEQLMPDLLEDGLPQPVKRNKFDFAEWADGRAWRFVKGQDYHSSTETFREHVRRWANDEDERGDEIPLAKADAVALGVQFARRNGRASGQRRDPGRRTAA